MPTEWGSKRQPTNANCVPGCRMSAHSGPCLVSEPMPVTTNPGLHPDFKRALEALKDMEWHGHQKQMYVELLPNFAEERLLHVPGAEQIAREWNKRCGNLPWGELTSATQDMRTKIFAKMLNDGVIVAGPQLFRQVD